MNVLSDAADALYGALERAVAIYKAEHPGTALRPYRTPPLSPATPAVWLGLPVLTTLAPIVHQTWLVTVAVDGDQPEQVDALYAIVARVWDEIAAESGFNPDGGRPENIPVRDSAQAVMAYVVSVEHSTGARTLCPPQFANTSA